MTVLACAIGVVVGCLLLASGWAKARAGTVVETAENYRILPSSWVRVLAPALPWVEILLGAALLVRAFMNVALLAAACLFLAFGAGVLTNLLRGRRIDCGCRAGATPISWSLLAQDVVLAVLCALAVAHQPSGLGLALAGRAELAAGDALALTCAVLDVWLTYLILTTARTARRLVSVTAPGEPT